jgi:choline-sulfatase
MRPSNLLFILSDEHARDIAGCYGHPLVRTPNIDRLAENGTRFTSAYTNCPICVPARASLATGRYVHDIRYWDNGISYDGRVPSWHRRLRDQGFTADSIGKLHFRGKGSDHGFSNEIDPLNVVDGVGDILGCLREDPPFRQKRKGITDAGPGDSTYQEYDVRSADNACRWMSDHASDEKPWALFLGLVCPHPPYIAPPELYNTYPTDRVPMPPQWRQADWPDHPALDHFRRFFHFDPQFTEAEIRKAAAAYCGVCTHLDQQIGRVLDAVETLGLGDNTRIIYTSDHGECLGARGIFGKFTMYEESAAVPLILAGPDVPEGRVVDTPVSLVDCHPSVIEAVGADAHLQDVDLPGASLWHLASTDDHDRTVFSEYHAVGSRSAIYMLRDSRHKYVHYVNDRPQLFDLVADPREEVDLADDPASLPVLEDFEKRLRGILDPEATDQKAKADQRAVVESFGGRDAVLARGAFDNSPVPGESPAFRKH